MFCPACRGLLREYQSRKNTIDVCSSCGGIWFDEGELLEYVTNLTEKQELYPELTPVFFKARDVLRVEDLKPEIRYCPRCTQCMNKFNYAYDSNIFLDRCPGCGGIWTDPGEAGMIAGVLQRSCPTRELAAGLIERERRLDRFRAIAALGESLSRPARLIDILLPAKVVLPLKAKINSGGTPYVTGIIIFACILIFVIQGLIVSDFNLYFHKYGFLPGRFVSHRLFTALFIHGGLFHLLGNIWGLWVFGGAVENKLGGVRFSTLYLLSGVAGAAMFSLMNSATTQPAVGASGAIAGILGAYVVFYPHSEIEVFIVNSIVHLPCLLLIGAWFLIDLIIGLLIMIELPLSSGWAAHIGGFLSGVLLAILYKRISPDIKSLLTNLPRP